MPFFIPAARLGVSLTSSLLRIKAEADLRKARELAEETYEEYNRSLFNLNQSYNQIIPTLEKYKIAQSRCFQHIDHLIQIMEMTEQIDIYQKFPQAKILKSWNLKAESIGNFADTNLDAQQILLAGLNTTNKLLSAVLISSFANAIYVGISTHSWTRGIDSFYSGLGNSFSMICMASEMSMSCDMAIQSSQALIAAQQYTVETKAIIVNLHNLSTVILPCINQYLIDLTNSICSIDDVFFNLIIELDTISRNFPLSSHFSENLELAIQIAESLLKTCNTPILGKNEKIIVDSVTILEVYHSKYFGGVS